MVAALVLVLVAAGCSTGGVQTLSIPDPPVTTVAPPAPPETLPPGLASRTEAPVAGVTTTTVPALGPGPASVNGTVTGPSGPVAGATVEVDRFVGDSYASARTTTAADGTWVFRNLLGGDYRIRAWQAPVLDMDSPVTIFLVANQPQSVNLQVVSYAGNAVQIALDPVNPVQNQPTNLVVQVTQPAVDANGVFTSPPVVGASVLLVNGPAWKVINGNPLATNDAGQVTFEVKCTTTGSDPLAAKVGRGAAFSLAVPACSPPPSPPTTSAPPNPTSTTCPPNAPATQPTTTSGSGGSC